MEDHKIPASVQLVSGESIRFAALADGDGKKRRFRMTAYTGAVVQTGYGRLILDIAGVIVGAERKPVLLNHVRDQIVGYSDKVRTEDSGLVEMEGVVSDQTEAGREVASLADEGFPWQASVGVEFIRGKVEQIREGDTVKANGKIHKGPLTIAHEWKLKEASFTPLGADEKTAGAVLSSKAGACIAKPERELTVEELADQHWAKDHRGCNAKFKTKGAYTRYLAYLDRDGVDFDGSAERRPEAAMPSHDELRLDAAIGRLTAENEILRERLGRTGRKVLA